MAIKKLPNNKVGFNFEELKAEHYEDKPEKLKVGNYGVSSETLKKYAEYATFDSLYGTGSSPMQLYKYVPNSESVMEPGTLKTVVVDMDKVEKDVLTKEDIVNTVQKLSETSKETSIAKLTSNYYSKAFMSAMDDIVHKFPSSGSMGKNPCATSIPYQEPPWVTYKGKNPSQMTNQEFQYWALSFDEIKIPKYALSAVTALTGLEEVPPDALTINYTVWKRSDYCKKHWVKRVKDWYFNYGKSSYQQT